jgi:CBS domain containing-hemolysin-like protein
MFPKKSHGMNKPMLFLSNIIIFIVFTVIYWFMETSNPGEHFGDTFDPIYFSIITHTTIGFGDISPKTIAARRVTSAHAILTLIFTLYYL